MLDIKSFTNWGGQGEQTVGIIHSEKLENHKNSTHTKIQFYIISIILFFSMMDITIFTNAGVRRQASGRQGVLSVHKNEKITRTVPILKSNFK